MYKLDQVISELAQLEKLIGYAPIVIGSSALVLHGVIDYCNDIDVVVKPKDYNIASSIPGIDPGNGSYEMPFTRWDENKDSVMSLPDLQLFYRTLGRPKDHIKLELIKNFLNQEATV